MARTARKLSQLNTYTVVLRGKQEIFKSATRREMFFTGLSKSLAGVQVYAYALSKRDAYLVVHIEAGTLSDFVKRVTVSFARRYNSQYINLGKVFVDRYLSEPLNSNDEILNAIKNVNLLGYTAGKSNGQFVTSYADYFSDAIICTDFVTSNANIDLSTFSPAQVATASPVIRLKKYSDQEVADYIYYKYNIKATDINKLSKGKLSELVSDVLSVTKASARQLFRITRVPLRFLWSLAKGKDKANE